MPKGEQGKSGSNQPKLSVKDKAAKKLAKKNAKHAADHPAIMPKGR